MFSRIQLMKLHALLAAFIFPVALMFLITGALYTWEIKGNYHTENYPITLDSPLEPALEALVEKAEDELLKLSVSPPSGKPKLKKAGNHFYLEWSGAQKDISLEPTDTALTAQLSIKHTSWYRQLVQLHKAKGGLIFKMYAGVFAIALLLLLISGFVMAWQTPKLKQLTLLTSLLGIATFVAAVLLS